MEGLGVRCVADRPWITAAETCESAMAQLVAGNEAAALELFMLAQAHRLDDGAYLTGIVYPEGTSFPDAERTSYTAAAVVLAADALSRTTDCVGPLPRGGRARLHRHKATPSPTDRLVRSRARQVAPRLVSYLYVDRAAGSRAARDAAGGEAEAVAFYEGLLGIP